MSSWLLITRIIAIYYSLYVILCRDSNSGPATPNESRTKALHHPAKIYACHSFFLNGSIKFKNCSKQLPQLTRTLHFRFFILLTSLSSSPSLHSSHYSSLDYWSLSLHLQSIWYVRRDYKNIIYQTRHNEHTWCCWTYDLKNGNVQVQSFFLIPISVTL